MTPKNIRDLVVEIKETEIALKELKCQFAEFQKGCGHNYPRKPKGVSYAILCCRKCGKLKG